MERTEINFFMEVKEVREDGTFDGIASVYDVEDLGGDIIEKGAFKKTLSENPTVPILWQHQSDEVIGQGEVKESGGKVLIAGKLDLEDATGQKAYQKLKKGLIKGLSIGFQTIKAKWEEIEEQGKSRLIRRIQELKLWEVSVVTFPMLPQAQVTRVKSTEDLEARVRELEAKIDAIQAAPKSAQSTPPEPPEPVAQPQPANEPEALHSLLTFLKGQCNA